MLKQLRIYFSGNVQGVGFRSGIEKLSHDFKVAGFVRNLADGRVEVNAQGEEAELGNFMRAILEGEMRKHIRIFDPLWSNAMGEKFEGFVIRRTSSAV